MHTKCWSDNIKMDLTKTVSGRGMNLRVSEYGPVAGIS